MSGGYDKAVPALLDAYSKENDREDDILFVEEGKPEASESEIQRRRIDRALQARVITQAVKFPQSSLLIKTCLLDQRKKERKKRSSHYITHSATLFYQVFTYLDSNQAVHNAICSTITLEA